MKTRNLIFGALLVLSSAVYGADEVTDEAVTADIAATQTVDELVEKMNKVQHQHRYRYMNAIKQQLSTTKEKERAEKIADVLGKIENSKASQGMGTGLGNQDGSGTGGGNSGGSGGNGGGNGGGGGRS